MNAEEVAKRLVERVHPTAEVVLLAGSHARDEATGTSDLDLVLIFPGEGQAFRETVREEDRLVEVFAYTPDQLRRWWEADKKAGTCDLIHMCATGLLLVGGKQGQGLQAQAEVLLAAGPLPVPEADLEAKRYRVTASLDDLRDVVDPGERQAIAATLLMDVAELGLISHRAWRGHGKWLVRRLRAVDPDLAQRILAAHQLATATGQVDDLVEVGEEVLLEVGGPLAQGYRRG